ncbi:unnamed protein product [Moneuplotes crassus]|uniref:Uncharacterized protein n=1 Tax=Euplotes crassus TaxID=5936 RepID=A0AAD1U668_EUPCR|nr:unnamed protein product [Moneuplotes crassus]
MSVYNGFSTRLQESTYSKTLYNLLFLLQLKITKDCNQTPIEQNSFKIYFKKLFLKLSKMEENKFLPPKFSVACEDLAKLFKVEGICSNISTMSKTSSDISLVSVPGMRDNQPLSPHSQVELQTIKEKQERRRKKGFTSKSSSRKNSIIFSQTKQGSTKKHSCTPILPESYTTSQRDKSEKSGEKWPSFDKRAKAGLSSGPRKRIFKVVKSHERTEIAVSVKRSKKSNILFYDEVQPGHNKSKQRKLPQIKGHKSQNPSPVSQRSNNLSNFPPSNSGNLSTAQHKKILAHLSSKHGFDLNPTKKSPLKRSNHRCKSDKKTSPRGVSKHQESFYKGLQSKSPSDKVKKTNNLLQDQVKLMSISHKRNRTKYYIKQRSKMSTGS